MKKKSLRLERLSLQKTTIVRLASKEAAIVKGGASDSGCEVAVSNPGGALSCIGHTCESWLTEDLTCRNCAEM
ncbi:class I lanthipeptide [Taibaiella koreensis]|uniref:class I lanthipeptide n=1 Tax=Taibaiella koreensis TaxID=1268548 RepID=UPI0013C2B991|nr:class I lanthipeptide [Taibaiella koreensis]